MSGNLAHKAETEDGVLAQAFAGDVLVDQKTLDDYYAFFSGKEVDMLPYVYAEPSDSYNALVHAPAYYLFRDEVNTIAHNQDTLRKYLAGVTDIVEIGPGCDYTVENKTVPILNCAADLKRYHAIDYSKTYLDVASNAVKKLAPEIDLFSIEADLMNGSINITHTLGEKKCVMSFGSTLGNFTVSDQLSFIQKIAQITNSGDIFIFAVDSNRDAKSVLEAYENEYFYSFTMQALNYFVTINPEFAEHILSFEPKCLWDESNSLNYGHFIAKNDLSFNFKHFGTINIKKGQMLGGIKSRKLNDQDVKKLLKNNFDLLEILGYSGRVKAFVCQRI